MAIRKQKKWGSIKPSVGYGVDWGDSISNGLVSRWLLNEGAGQKIFDLFKNNNGTLGSGGGLPTWSAGKLGKALAFTSAGSTQINCPSGKLPILKTTPFSVSAWFKTSTTTSQYIVGIWNYPTNPGWAVGINMQNAVLGGPCMLFFDASAANGFQATSLTNYADGVWHHAVYIYDGSGAESGIQIIVDGAVSGLNSSHSGSANPGTLVDTGARFGNVSSIGYFNGSLDMPAIWLRKLTVAEARRLYTEPFAGIETPKRRYLNSSGGSTIAIKTWNGLAQASVKTYMGLATASTKTWDAVSNV